MVPDGRFRNVGLIVCPPLSGKGAPQHGYKITRADTFAKTKCGGAIVYMADDAILIG
jgi:hypothetical protein